MKESYLLKALLEASHSPNSKILESFLKAVSSTIPSKMCTLWKVNNLANTLSILAREDYKPPPEKEYEFVYPIQGSLTGYLMEQMTPNKPYFKIDSIYDEPYWSLHKSQERVKKLGLKKMLCISIPNSEQSSDTDAILNIYPNDDFDFSDDCIDIIRDHFSLALSRTRFIEREEVTRTIIQIYEQKSSKDLASILHPIINRVLKKYCKYEGCSVFLWDPFSNLLSLTQTTGIKYQPKKNEVYYYLGEGLTGGIAQKKEHLIIKNLANIDDTNLDKNYEHKWLEDTEHVGKSFMGIPIMSPSRPNELLGVIRFTNRLNFRAPVVDFFCNKDFTLVKHVCNLIALYMEYEQSERVRTAFAKQMAHEMMAPAAAIRGSAERLIRKWNSPNFPIAKVYDYLNSILDHAELQVALTRTIQYMWKGSTSVPRIHRYQVDRYDLKENIIQPCKKLVIPFTRRESLTFNNIVIVGRFPKMFVDKYAFEQVFFNLLTNAIKYRDKQNMDSFYISIKSLGYDSYSIPVNDGYESKKGYLIIVEDNGVGIEPDEKDKIFLLGYRKKGIEKTNVRGLGLGLTVVKQILEDFWCHIWISNLKKPTRFEIFLPDRLRNDSYLKTDEWQME
ncbi:MAG: GAF domain-containing sensor histidine kinase [Pseudomonadota bacterium]